MNYIQFRNKMKTFPNFSVREIQKHFPDFDSRRLVEWQKKGYIQKLRNRFYYFSDQEISESFLYYTANEMYSPSYVSLESALSKYGFIPEGVFQITSCTTRKTQSFNTSLNSFRHRHLKAELYFGYHLEAWGQYHYAIAEPEKTLIDYLYLHHDINDINDIASLRWNADMINDHISFEKLGVYENHISSPALSRRLNILKQFLNASS